MLRAHCAFGDEAESRAEGLCLAGRLLAEEGKLEEARKKFREAMAEDPELARPHWDLALLEQMGFRDLDKAVAHWEEARGRIGDGGLSGRTWIPHAQTCPRPLSPGADSEKAVEALSAFVSKHRDAFGENDATVYLLERMKDKGEASRAVRLADMRSRNSTENDACLAQSLATILHHWGLPQ